MRSLRPRSQKTSRREGSALLLTLFTVAALLTLGTTFIAISVRGSQKSQNDKDSELARTVANYGANWVLSYMALAQEWYTPNVSTNTGTLDGSDQLWLLQPTDTDSWASGSATGHTVKWCGRTVAFTACLAQPSGQPGAGTAPGGTPPGGPGQSLNAALQPFYWEFSIDPQAKDASSVVDLSTVGGTSSVGQVVGSEIGVFNVFVKRLSSQTPGLHYSTSQPVEYEVESTAYIYNRGDQIYNTNTTPVTPNAATARAVRTITYRVRPQSPIDFSLYEENMRSWIAPGLNTQYGSNTVLDNGLGTVNANGTALDQQASQLLPQLQGVQMDSIGIPSNYTMNGNFAVDGAATANNQADPFAQANGSIHIFADPSTPGSLQNIHFTGNTSFAAGSNNTYGSNNTAFSTTNTNMTSIYQGSSAPNYSAKSRGLPSAANYLTAWVADTSSWPKDWQSTPNASVPTANVGLLTTGGSLTTDSSGTTPISVGTAQAATGDTTMQQNQNSPPGYVKVATPAQGAVGVTPGQGTGYDVEYDKTQSGAQQQPGFARVQISFTQDSSGNGFVHIQKVGAYSGAPVAPAQTIQVSGTQDQLPNNTIYVDGGNVEVQGKIPSSLTVVAAASSDRPTTAVPVTMQNGVATPVPNAQPVLITPQQQAGIKTSIYEPADTKLLNGSALFPTDSSGKITGPIPAWDPDTQKYVWPAYDPTKIADQSGQATSVTSSAILTREGNISVVGNLEKASGSQAALGLVAQNFILLSDQRPGAQSTLKVDAALMSLQQSVQYGGFATGGENNYWSAMAVDPSGSTQDANGNYWPKMAGSIPRPLNQVNNGTFQLNGSIIGQYADVESSQNGVGYTTQSFTQDKSLSNNLPPMFPNFSRTTEQGPIVWLVVATSDSQDLKAGLSN